jgi:hypothetical protein
VTGANAWRRCIGRIQLVPDRLERAECPDDLPLFELSILERSVLLAHRNDAMREAADQEATAVGGWLDPEVFAPQRLQPVLAELGQSGDLLRTGQSIAVETASAPLAAFSGSRSPPRARKAADRVRSSGAQAAGACSRSSQRLI